MEKIIVNHHLHDIAIAAFRQNTNHGEAVNFQEYEKARAGMMKQWERLFKDLTGGTIDYFYYWSGPNIVIFTRSIRQPEAVQRSTYWKRGEEYIALSDTQYTSIADAEKRGGVKDRVVIFTGRNAARTA